MIPAGDDFRADPCGPREPTPCPHTYGVRVGMCAAVATKPCRPTACVKYATNLPSPSTDHCSLLGYRYVSPDGDGWAVVATAAQVVATAAHFLAQSPSDHCSLITVHSSHTFSAKEKDSETGLSYFGSRYYSSDLSIWLSVDPMSDKYPSFSPYVYCADNPVKLVDPNGEEWYVNQDGNIVEGTNKDDHTLYAVKGKKNEFGDKLIYRRGDQKGKEISMPVDDEIMRSFKTDENGYSQIIRL